MPITHLQDRPRKAQLHTGNTIVFSDLFDDIISTASSHKDTPSSFRNHRQLLDNNTQLYLAANLINLHEAPINL